MTRFRAPRAARSAALIACLGLFVLGSNYCLLGGLSGSGDMACMTIPTPEAASPGCGKCHGAEKSDGATRSCCPDPVVAPSMHVIEKADAASSASFTMAIVVESPATPALSSHRGRPAASESPPRVRLVRAPLPARAPPLA